MNTCFASFLVVMTSLVAVRGVEFFQGRLPSSPMERAFHDVMRLKRSTGDLELSRQTRSASGGMPCVTVSYLAELKDRFENLLDHNNDGKATFAEVENFLRRFKPRVSPETVEAFIRRRDSNGNGAIDLVPEYVQDISEPDYTLEGATEWFNLHDSNDDGFVTEEELVTVAKALGMSPEQALDTVRGYYMAADLDKDNKLSFDEFKSLYNQ